MPNEDDIERVLAMPQEVAPFAHEEPWTGKPGGAWKFWNEIYRRRQQTPPMREEVA